MNLKLTGVKSNDDSEILPETKLSLEAVLPLQGHSTLNLKRVDKL